MSMRDLISKSVPWVFIFFIGIAAGLSISLVKIAVEGGLNPLGITLFQAIFSSALLWIICLIRKRPLKAIITNIRLVLVIALLGLAIPAPIFYVVADHLPVSVLAIVIALIPMFTYGASIPFGFEQFSWARIMGLVMGVIAIMLIVVPENSLPNRSAVLWIFIAMIVVLCDAAENVILAAKSALALGPIRLALGMNAAVILMVGPIAYWADVIVWPSLAMTDVNLSLWGIGLIYVITYTMFIHTVNRYGPVFSSQAGYIVTLSGVFWGILIFNESNSIWVWGSLATMIAGLSLVKPNKVEETHRV